MKTLTPVMMAGVCALMMTIPVSGWAQEPAGPWDALTQGTLNANLRLRYEHVNEDELEDANAWTARLRLGYATRPIAGVHAFVEFEGTETADKDGYNAAGVHGNSARAVVADPESAEFNQAYLDYSGFDSVVRGGRQRILLDNQRFVGNVGWRQNEQTFDAISASNQSLSGLRAYYAYISQVNRIFGSEAEGAKRRYDSDSHLANLSYTPCSHAMVTAYGYFLDFASADALSSDTVGISLTGSADVADPVTVGYRAEYAQQGEAGDNPDAYDADYLHLSAKSTYQGVSLEIGYESLGGEQTGIDAEGNPTYASFQTPLATLHKFNGFADKFLSTPGEGLEDLYVSLGGALPWALKGAVIYHDFGSDVRSIDYGSEIDAVLRRPVNEYATVVAKYAHYNADERFADTDKIWVQLDLVF